MTTRSEKAEAIAILILVICSAGALGFTTLGKGGALREKWDARQARRARASVLHEHAAELERIAYRIGPPQATITIFEFSDYECPFCRQADSLVTRWISSRGRTAVLYLDLPLESIHPHAFAAAVAAGCADAQGRFLALHARLMSTTAWQVDQDWGREAVAAGVPDTAAFSGCVERQEPAARIRRSMELASLIGIASTPAFLGRRGAITSIPTDEALSSLR